MEDMISPSLMIKLSPFLNLQVTVVGGEPVETQFRLEDELPGVNTKFVIWGLAVDVKSYDNNVNAYTLYSIGYIYIYY